MVIGEPCASSSPFLLAEDGTLWLSALVALSFSGASTARAALGKHPRSQPTIKALEIVTF
jgi:hypothetical protein